MCVCSLEIGQGRNIQNLEVVFAQPKRHSRVSEVLNLSLIWLYSPLKTSRTSSPISLKRILYGKHLCTNLAPLSLYRESLYLTYKKNGSRKGLYLWIYIRQIQQIYLIETCVLRPILSHCRKFKFSVNCQNKNTAWQSRLFWKIYEH